MIKLYFIKSIFCCFFRVTTLPITLILSNSNYQMKSVIVVDSISFQLPITKLPISAVVVAIVVVGGGCGGALEVVEVAVGVGCGWCGLHAFLARYWRGAGGEGGGRCGVTSWVVVVDGDGDGGGGGGCHLDLVAAGVLWGGALVEVDVGWCGRLYRRPVHILRSMLLKLFNSKSVTCY